MAIPFFLSPAPWICMNDYRDSPRDECGIVGIFAPNEDVATMAFFGLFALQHRGQESACIYTKMSA
jgi:amidophosphoribosyltransferase